MSMPFFLKSITPEEVIAIENEPSVIGTIVESEDDSTQTYLEHGWDIIKYCLEKIDSDFSVIIEGDRYIEHDLNGMGQWYLNPDEVKVLSEKISRIEIDDIMENIDVDDMKKKHIYGVRDRDTKEVIATEVEGELKNLKKFYTESASKGMGILYWH